VLNTLSDAGFSVINLTKFLSSWREYPSWQKEWILGINQKKKTNTQYPEQFLVHNTCSINIWI
jgi:hypothetical protein